MFRLIIFVVLALTTAYGIENDFVIAVAAWGMAVGTAFWMAHGLGVLVSFCSVLWIAYIPGGF